MLDKEEFIILANGMKVQAASSETEGKNLFIVWWCPSRVALFKFG